MQDFRIVGKRCQKLDGLDKATGRSRYIQDIMLPGMLYGKILYSQYAHARIAGIDVSRAITLPGVFAVLTGEDIADIPMGVCRDNRPLKKGKVRSFRDEVAAVAAIDPGTADEALNLIEVSYESLPTVTDPESAMCQGSPLVHESLGTNVLTMPWQLHYGDVDAARRDAAFTVRERFSTTWVTHCCMGTSGAIAEFDPDDHLTIYTNTQVPSLAQKKFGEALAAMGLHNRRVRVIKPCIGGGFGSKLDTYAYEYIAILLAYRTRRPVKIVFDRTGEFLATSPRQPTITHISQGCDRHGRLLFRDVGMILDNGAYTSWGVMTPSLMMMPITSLYRVPNVRYQATCVYTNNTYCQAMRGYGNPQVTFAIESSMDMLAEAAGIDPLAFRHINANQPGDVSPQGFRITTCGLHQCLDTVKARLDWDTPCPPGEGKGVSAMIHVGGGARVYKSDGCGTILKLDDLGQAVLITGATDMGQGCDTVIAQMVAEELGLNLEDIHVIHSDTDVCPWDAGAHASRTTFVAGNSALGAARQIKMQILEMASRELNAPTEKIVLRSRHARHVEDPDRRVKIAKLLRKAHYCRGGKMLMAEYFYDPSNENLDENFRGNLSMTYTFGVHGVHVRVDAETGKVDILKYVAAHDVGRAINPLLLEGQVYGGVMMGIGFALSEEMIIEKGKIMNPDFRDYRILTAKDVVPIEALILETPDPDGPYGAKGIGESGCVPTAAAIANAVYNAVGVRIRDLPMTPERVLAGNRKQSPRCVKPGINP